MGKISYRPKVSKGVKKTAGNGGKGRPRVNTTANTVIVKSHKKRVFPETSLSSATSPSSNVHPDQQPASPQSTLEVRANLSCPHATHHDASHIIAAHGVMGRVTAYAMENGTRGVFFHQDGSCMQWLCSIAPRIALIHRAVGAEPRHQCDSHPCTLFMCVSPQGECAIIPAPLSSLQRNALPTGWERKISALECVWPLPSDGAGVPTTQRDDGTSASVQPHPSRWVSPLPEKVLLHYMPIFSVDDAATEDTTRRMAAYFASFGPATTCSAGNTASASFEGFLIPHVSAVIHGPGDVSLEMCNVVKPYSVNAHTHSVS